MSIWFRGTQTRAPKRIEPTSEEYLLSVLDSDGDQVLVDAPIQASDCEAAWNQAIAIALRACHGSGAMPMTLGLVRATRGGIPG